MGCRRASSAERGGGAVVRFVTHPQNHAGSHPRCAPATSPSHSEYWRSVSRHPLPEACRFRPSKAQPCTTRDGRPAPLPPPASTARAGSRHEARASVPAPAFPTASAVAPSALCQQAVQVEAELVYGARAVVGVRGCRLHAWSMGIPVRGVNQAARAALRHKKLESRRGFRKPCRRVV